MLQTCPGIHCDSSELKFDIIPFITDNHMITSVTVWLAVSDVILLCCDCKRVTDHLSIIIHFVYKMAYDPEADGIMYRFQSRTFVLRKMVETAFVPHTFLGLDSSADVFVISVLQHSADFIRDCVHFREMFSIYTVHGFCCFAIFVFK